MSQEQESCATCRFWKLGSYDPEASGHCRFNPPSIVEKMVSDSPDFEAVCLATTHPVTFADQWCGKWERKG